VAAAGAPAGWVSRLAVAAGGTRRFLVYVPAGVRSEERLPLVLMLHGCGQDAQGFARLTRMSRVAARERFIVACAEQDRFSHGQRCWHWYSIRSRRAFTEAGILLAAVEQTCLLHPADPGRVALVGLSAGAGMAAVLAVRYAARFRALVMHSGVPPGMADTTATAIRAMRGDLPVREAVLPTAWPPLLVIQGTADRVVAPVNGEAAAALWARAGGAKPHAGRRVQRGNRRPMLVRDYRAGQRLVARLCLVEGLGHAWSGGDASEKYGDPAGPDASRLAWSFIARQLRD
jgi:poly(hydroxyalkanoate) depolymerase family esterase